MMAGFIKLYRGWRECGVLDVSGPMSEAEAWLWLIENAAWKETARRTTQGGVIKIERGQMHVSLQGLSSAWNWSIKRVRCFLERLEKGSMVGTQKGKGGTLLTICNYSKYQDKGHTEGTQDGKAGAQLGHTQEEDKKKEEKTVGSRKRSATAQIPDDWQPETFRSGECQKIVAGWSPDVVAAQAEKFASHHRAKGNRYADWQAAWKTWVLNSVQFKQPEKKLSDGWVSF